MGTMANLKTDIDTLQSLLMEKNSENHQFKDDLMSLQSLVVQREQDIKRFKEELSISVENNNILAAENKTLSTACQAYEQAN